MKRAFLLFLLALPILQACKTVPMTGRRQVALIPAGQMNALSLTSYNTLLGESNVDKTSRDARKIRQIGTQITQAVTKYLKQHSAADRIKGFEWEYNLIVDETVNAFAMPGGKIAFYSGIMPVCDNDNGIAVVMAHEIAHVVAKHGNERMTQGLAQQFGGMALQVALADKPAETQALFMQAYGIGTNVAAILPYSRLHENEADELGLMFMAMAGYDPREAPKFWERLTALGGAQPPVFLSTHPSNQQRIDNMNELMPEALKFYNK
ncbi:MAG TPA: peptidase M48 [Cytophagales bacterium]|nr:peptidase M48 [Cytophagales bacterium]HAA19067.1 peptidase M48 [Cytophagales bacterium]